MNLFKRAIVLLTTLFVSVMPLHAASDGGVPSAGDCTTFEMLISPDAKADFEAKGLQFVSLSKEQIDAVTKALEEEFGSPPYEIGKATIVKMNGSSAITIFWFTPEGCLLGRAKLSGENMQKVLEAIEGKKA
jgi:hypothetical protein